VRVVSFLLFAAMLWQIRKHGLGRQATTPAAFRSSMGQTLALTAGFLVSVPVALLVDRWAFVFWAVVPIAGGIVGHRLRRGTDA
jgi:TMEM175 potassium channel family protein